MRGFLIFFLFIPLFSLSAVDISDIYADADSFLDRLEDKNSGLTSFQTLRIPMGGKQESMGTARTAAADDITFFESNPAASSFLKFTELAFFHNNWIADANVETIAFTSRYGNLGTGAFGKFLYVPFTGYDLWGSRVSKGYYSESILSLNGSYRFFSSYDFWGIAAGSNLKLAYRNIPSKIYASQNGFAVAADLGLLTKFDMLKFFDAREKNASLGVAIKNIGLEADRDDPLPSEISAGIAYVPLKFLTLSFDFIYPFVIFSDVPKEKFGFAAGVDAVVTDFFSLQGGFLFRGSNPRFSLGSEIMLRNINFNINYTLDLTSQTNPDRFSVAASFNMGDKGRAHISAMADGFYIKGLYAYSQGDLDEAIKNWQEALKLDKTFSPAEKNLKIALRTKELMEEMISIQSVE